MKTFITLLLTLTVLSIDSVIAQPGTMDRPNRPNFDAERMVTTRTALLTGLLNLNDTQQAKVKALAEETAKEIEVIKEEGQKQRAQNRGKMMAIHQQQDEKMKSILTDEQWVIYQKHVEEQRAQRQQNQRPNRDDRPRRGF